MFHHVAIARRFDVETLVAAYARGLFAMGDEDGVIHWIASDPRFVLPVGGLRIPKSLARLWRRRPFELRVDTAFRRVMEQCAVDRGGDNLNWITPRMVEVYTEAHRLGFAHSVEAWQGGVLVGGLYGVAIGSAFFGESMFTRRDLGVSNASKMCLLELDRRLSLGGFTLLDSQEANPHMRQFGGEDISFDHYRGRLAEAVGNGGSQAAAWV